MAANPELSEIQYFYKNKSFLLTGVTGFVGKLVLEKLLRSLYPKNVYVLVRDKDGVSAEARCSEVFDSAAFQPLRRIDPEFYKKVTLIQGDLQKPDLGLSKNDKELIQKEVECIFHCGTASKLDETLLNATHVNVRGTKLLLDIAREIKNLKAFVFLSSVYSNFPRYEIHEEFYEPRITADKLIKSFDNVNEDQTQQIQQQLLTDWPNAYTFTLSVIEDYIKTDTKGIPVSIVRPSLLLPSETEPITGYVENINGLYGDTVAYALGVNKVNYYNNGVLDAIPVDYVVNLIIASGWYAGIQKIRLQRGDVSTAGANIYHCISSQEKPITTDDWMGVIHTVTTEVPSVKMLQLPTQFNTNYYYTYKILTFLLHTCMAFLCDTGLKLAGKTPSLKVMKKIQTVSLRIVQKIMRRAIAQYDSFIVCILLPRSNKPVRIIESPVLQWRRYPIRLENHIFSRIMKMYDSLHRKKEQFSPYLLKQWYFSNDNTQKLLKRISFNDRALFNFDIFNLNWQTYFDSYGKGVRVYLLKDPMSTLTEAKQKQYKKLIAQLVSAAIFVTVLYVISKFFLFKIFFR